MMTAASSSVEFAQFIADVSDPGTGIIRSDRLSRWLEMPEEAIVAAWRKSGLRWDEFASNLLAVLDEFQDLTQSLSQSLVWYRNVPLPGDSGKAAAQHVAEGQVVTALADVRLLRSDFQSRQDRERLRTVER